MFLFPVIKSLNTEEKNKLSEIYKKLSKLEIEAMKLIDYSEKKKQNLLKIHTIYGRKLKKIL